MDILIKSCLKSEKKNLGKSYVMSIHREILLVHLCRLDNYINLSITEKSFFFFFKPNCHLFF